MKTLNRSGRGITNPLFTPTRIADMSIRKHLINKGIIVPATKVAKVVYTDKFEQIRNDLISSGVIKTKTMFRTDELYLDRYLDHVANLA